MVGGVGAEFAASLNSAVGSILEPYFIVALVALDDTNVIIALGDGAGAQHGAQPLLEARLMEEPVVAVAYAHEG